MAAADRDQEAIASVAAEHADREDVGGMQLLAVGETCAGQDFAGAAQRGFGRSMVASTKAP